MSEPEIRMHLIDGLDGIVVRENVPLGHLMVEHDGTITWDQMQVVKNEVWMPDARAIEAYPAEREVVNTGNYRHLWRLGQGDFMPDMLGRLPPPSRLSWAQVQDLLIHRFHRAWREADEVCR